MKFVAHLMALLKKVIVFTARKCGVDLFLLKEGYHYVPDIYGKSSAKMFDIRDDVFFRETANKVIHDKRTLLYYDRLHVIYQSLQNIHNQFISQKEPMNIVEVGVYKGGGSYFIASILKEYFKGNINLYCVDTFEGHSKEDLINTKHDVHCPSWFHDTDFENVKSYLEDFAFVQVIKNRIQDCEELFEGKNIHFAHLDVDLYHPMLFSLNFFSKKLQQGGIILIDDFGFVTCPGVRKAVSEFMENNPFIFYKFELSTGQCLLVKMSR